MDGTGGRIASLCRVCVACHTALDTPSTASPQHHQKRDIDNFRIPKVADGDVYVKAFHVLLRFEVEIEGDFFCTLTAGLPTSQAAIKGEQELPAQQFSVR